MNSKLILSIAKSLLLARWKQTLVAAVGVTFSITMFITLLGFMNGLNDLLDGLILNRTPDIRLYNEIKPNQNQPVNAAAQYKDHYNFIRSIKAAGTRENLYNSSGIMRTLEEDQRVAGFSTKVIAQVFFNEGSIDINGIIHGINEEAESRLFRFSDYVTTGSSSDISKVPNSIILGKGLADKLLAEPGDVVQVTTSRGQRFQLKVVGYFQSGIREFDNVQCYASINTVQKLLGEPSNYIQEIQVRLHDMKDAPPIAAEYRRLFGADAEDIQTANSQFETGSSIRTLISFAV